MAIIWPRYNAASLLLYAEVRTTYLCQICSESVTVKQLVRIEVTMTVL